MPSTSRPEAVSSTFSVTRRGPRLAVAALPGWPHGPPCCGPAGRFCGHDGVDIAFLGDAGQHRLELKGARRSGPTRPGRRTRRPDPSRHLECGGHRPHVGRGWRSPPLPRPFRPVHESRPAGRSHSASHQLLRSIPSMSAPWGGEWQVPRLGSSFASPGETSRRSCGRGPGGQVDEAKAGVVAVVRRPDGAVGRRQACWGGRSPGQHLATGRGTVLRSGRQHDWRPPVRSGRRNHVGSRNV